MTSLNFENRRKLVEVMLTDKQQVEMLGRRADADNWAQAADDDRGRLETLSMIIFALQGTYTEAGLVQRWFTRPKAQLGNRAAADILTGAWNPESDDVKAVRNLAQYLCGDIEHAPVCQRCNPQPK